MKRKTENVLIFIIIILSSIMIIGSIYYRKTFPDQEFEQILYYVTNGMEKTSPDVINNVILSCIIPVGVVSLFIYMYTIKKTKNKIYIDINIKNKKLKIQIYPIKFIQRHTILYLMIICIIAILITIKGFKIDEYIINLLNETEIYDEYYVNAADVDLEFPEEKRNLIIIIAESIENTILNEESGGCWDYSIVPELENLAIKHTNFSNTNSIGGAFNCPGQTFSVAGIVGITSGVPLIVREVFKDVNIYEGNGKYLPGVYALGDVLRDNGYNLEVMMGSEAEFGGRKQYFTTHGDYKIFDCNYAIKHNYMRQQDKVWWGFEDDKLYEWSKEEITKLACEDKPFNYIMLTADTHFPDGYLSRNVEKKFDSQYENVHAYASKCIYEFVDWVQKQDFYEDTTIVIVGDHLGMQSEFYEQRIKEEYERTVYNVIINSAVEEKNTKNRQFTLIDMYPTILASIGANIEGEKLGLGTNLYSNEETIIEKLGYENFCNEIRKKSTFYNKNIFGQDYYLIKHQANNNTITN